MDVERTAATTKQSHSRIELFGVSGSSSTCLQRGLEPLHGRFDSEQRILDASQPELCHNCLRDVRWQFSRQLRFVVSSEPLLARSGNPRYLHLWQGIG